MPKNRIREIDEALGTLAKEVGAHVEFVCTGSHRKAIFTYNGKQRFDIISGTPRSSHTLIFAKQQAKRTLRSLGASI